MTRKIRVLVVDDELAIRELMGHRIKAVYESCEILMSWNGKDALQTVNNEKGRLDLIITDFYMPEATGMELTRAVKRLFPKIKIIIMSAMHDREEEALESGADAFLGKPFGFSELVKVINELIS